MRQKQNYWLFFSCMIVFFIGCATMQNRWDKAKSKNTIQSYEKFLRYHPKGTLSDEARTRIEKIKFKNVKTKNTIEAYKTFLIQHPKGIFADSVRSLIDNLYFKNSQTELYFDDYSRESYYCIKQLEDHCFSELCVNIETGLRWCGFQKQHRVAVQFESPFDKSRLINTQIFHSFANDNCHNCRFNLEILDENWNSIAKKAIVSETSGIVIVDFSDHDIIVGKIFSIAVDSENTKDICISIDNSNSGHSYVIFENNIPNKIEEHNSNDFFKKYNNGKYDFMIRSVVEKIN